MMFETFGRGSAAKGSGRQTSIAAMPTRAVRAPFITPSPKRLREPREDVAAGDRAEHVVADRDDPGGEQVRRDHAQQPPRAEEAGVRPVDLGDAPDHPHVLRERGEHVEQGERHDRGGGGDRARGGLDLGADHGVERLEGGALGHREDGVGVEHLGPLAGEAVELPLELGPAAVEAGEPLGEGGGRVAVGARMDRRRLGAEAVDAGETAEGPELADDMGERQQQQEPGQRHRDPCRASGSARARLDEIVVGRDRDDERRRGSPPRPRSARVPAAGGRRAG